MRSCTHCRFLAALLLAALGACGGPAEVPDAGADPVTCTFPTPALGTSAEATALAAAPQRCEQLAHAWVDDASLGEVRGRWPAAEMSPALLQALADDAALPLPRPPEQDVTLDLITYVTQDRGALVEASALIAYPKGGFPDAGPRDILLVLHGLAGYADACSPATTLTGQAIPALFASWGYLVVAPDLLGLRSDRGSTGFLHPYFGGQATALAALDSVRAAGRLSADERGGSCAAPRVLTYGPSQGGHAALWVDRLAGAYAPELELLGTVAAAPPADLVRQAELSIAARTTSTENIVAMFGTLAQWYGLDARLSEAFRSPFDTELIPALEGSCGDPEPPLPDAPTTAELFEPAIFDAATGGTFGTVEPWGCMFRENGLTTTSIARSGADSSSYGVLMVLGGADEVVDTPTERASFQTLCEAGMPVEMLECEGAPHLETAFWSLGEILSFLEARGAGEPFVRPTSCAPSAPVRCGGQP